MHSSITKSNSKSKALWKITLCPAWGKISWQKSVGIRLQNAQQPPSRSHLVLVLWDTRLWDAVRLIPLCLQVMTGDVQRQALVKNVLMLIRLGEEDTGDWLQKTLFFHKAGNTEELVFHWFEIVLHVTPNPATFPDLRGELITPPSATL